MSSENKSSNAPAAPTDPAAAKWVGKYVSSTSDKWVLEIQPAGKAVNHDGQETMTVTWKSVGDDKILVSGGMLPLEMTRNGGGNLTDNLGGTWNKK